MWTRIEVGSFSCRNYQQDSLFSYLAFLREHSLSLSLSLSLYIYIYIYIYRLYLFSLCFKVICWSLWAVLSMSWIVAENDLSRRRQRSGFLEEAVGVWKYCMKTLALVKRRKMFVRVQRDHERLSHTDSCLFLLYCSWTHTHTLSSSWVPWSPSNLHLSNLTGGTYGEESLIHKASGHLYYTRRNRPLDFCRPWIYRCCISVWHYVICLAVCQHQWKILNAS